MVIQVHSAENFKFKFARSLRNLKKNPLFCLSGRGQKSRSLKVNSVQSRAVTHSQLQLQTGNESPILSICKFCCRLKQPIAGEQTQAGREGSVACGLLVAWIDSD